LLHVWHFELLLPCPRSDRRKHHSKHEPHTKVQIHSLQYNIPRVEEVDDRLRHHWTGTKDSWNTSHWANHNGHVKGNINYKHWDNVRKMSTSSGPLLFQLHAENW
jgi:hypothetical protein